MLTITCDAQVAGFHGVKKLYVAKGLARINRKTVASRIASASVASFFCRFT
jgi:hypothetical protein